MSDVLIDRRGHALWLTLNRPEQRNALNADVLCTLTGALADARLDAGLRAIVITGAGDKAFCAGADLKSAAAKDGGAFQVTQGVVENALAAFFAEVERCTVPLVARVNGHAMGGGLGLVAACDLAVAADDALFATPEVKVGDMTLPQCLDYMTLMLDRMTLTEDAQEGFAAFTARRKPVWTGR